MTQNQCVVQIGHDRIEKILTVSECNSLKEGWPINLKQLESSAAKMAEEFAANQRRLPKKRLLKFHQDESDYYGRQGES